MDEAGGMHSAQRRGRKPSATFWTRFKYGNMALAAWQLAQRLSVGLKLFPGELQSLGGMPKPVQRAILACERETSRYIPGRLARYLGVDPKAFDLSTEAGRGEYRRQAMPEVVRAEENRNKVAASAAKDTVTTDVVARAERAAMQKRFVSIELPKNVPGFASVMKAIAHEAGCSPLTLRRWMGEAYQKCWPKPAAAPIRKGRAYRARARITTRPADTR
jgi:hypothetical protein